MALVNESRYVRVHDLRLGKNVMQFVAKVFDRNDLNSAELEAKLITCSYDVNAGNPFDQAYKYLKTIGNFQDFESDEEKMQNQQEIIKLNLAADDLINEEEKIELKHIPANDIIESTEYNKKMNRKKKTNVIKG